MIDDTEQRLDEPRGMRRPDFGRYRNGIRGAGLFVAGIGAALIALLLYGALVPSPPPLTTGDVTSTITQVLASQTPARPCPSRPTRRSPPRSC